MSRHSRRIMCLDLVSSINFVQNFFFYPIVIQSVCLEHHRWADVSQYDAAVCHGVWPAVCSVSQYDPRFGDAFWNSSKYNMVSYLLRMMTSWAIVVNVWYLPPMTRQVQRDTLFPPHVYSLLTRTERIWSADWRRQNMRRTSSIYLKRKKDN